MGVLGRLELGTGPPARGWRQDKGGSRTGWVEALAVEDEGLGRSRGGLTSKIHLAVDGHGRPVSILVTPGQAGDNPQLLALLDQVIVKDDSVGVVEWTFSVDSTNVRAHQHAAGARKKGAARPAGSRTSRSLMRRSAGRGEA